MVEQATRHGWIALLDSDGPFLSAAALDVKTVGHNWPTKLSAEQRALLTAAPGSESENGDGWDDSSWDGRRDRVATLLTDLLGYRAGRTLEVAPPITATHHIYRSRVTADFAVRAPGGSDDIRMVVLCGPDATDDPVRIEPSRTHPHDGWVSTPVQRAALLARHAKADLALVTNGREHLLVNVVTGATGSAIWTVNALEDGHARDAFVALLHKQRVLSRQTSLAKLIALSQDRQHELTDTLGRQVRSGAEALVNAISRANRTSRGRLLDRVSGQQVYAAVTRVLMRTVFLLVAEERGLLPVAQNRLYADQYAMSTLLDKLEGDAYRNRSAMERRAGAWQRMMALARAVHAGIDHHDLRLPAYGGSIFDPDEHPFLEGRIPTAGGGGEYEQLDLGVVDDFMVLTVLRYLQVANGQRISFRSLDVEQIGHVYEALLDHSAVIVENDHTAVVGLVGKAGNEPEVPLVTLEKWAAKSRMELGERLAALGVASEPDDIDELLERGLSPDSAIAQTLNVAVADRADLRKRVEPFAPLLRADARGVALVFLPGDVYVTETSNKRDYGTAYTPRSLADEIVRHTLDPVVFDPGPHNDEDQAKWVLRTPNEILELKICDPAVGSGAILVAAVRYLAEALLQSRVEAGELSAASLASGATDVESVDARVEARRLVVSRCVYGVDRDPMAVEMAKLSLWLIAMARDAPFSFLDHAMRHGDSLLGIVSLDQLRKLHLEPSRVSGGKGLALTIGSEGWWDVIDDRIGELTSLRKKLRSIPDDASGSIDEKVRLHQRAEAIATDLTAVADAVTAAYLTHAGGSAEDRDVAQSAVQARIADFEEQRDTRLAEATRRLEEDNPNPSVPRRPMHWPLTFPEVFVERDGFDAIVANPPFIKSQGLRDSVGSNYRDYCFNHLADGRKGKSDFIAYFAWRLTQLSTRAGFLATNSIAQGDTLKVGLLPITKTWVIYRAVRSTPWPGSAGVHISKVWMASSGHSGSLYLGDQRVPAIVAALEEAGSVTGPPLKLKANANLAFQGYQIIADGFEIDAQTAAKLRSSDPKSSDVIRPFVNGDTINGPSPLCGSDRFVIDFGAMSHAEARRYESAFEHVNEFAKPKILEKALPKEDGTPSSYLRWADRWWQFWSPRPSLRRSIKDLKRVIAMARTSKVFYPAFVPADWCLTDALVVFAYDDIGHFGVLTSTFHWWWAINPPGTGGSSLESRPRYTPTTSFQTFPQPEITPELESAAEALHGHREDWFETEEIGLLDGYNRVNDPGDASAPVVQLRRLHVGLDEATRAAYAACDAHHAWSDLVFDHDFYDCGGLGTRYTVSAETRETMMTWLLELNFRRYAALNRLTYEQVLKETGNA